MTLREIFFWKRELARVKQEFRQEWSHCPKCGSNWNSISWDAESDHEFLLVECQNRHLFRVNEDFWLFGYEDDAVFVPEEFDAARQTMQ